jgi:NAD(P)-dependent dehydrogenase (short-subunit alcohol dehydrogenase family)
VAFALDVADYAQVEAAVAEAGARFGGLDILVNNAGVIDPIGLLADCDPADWQRSISINLVGAFNGIRAALPVFLRRKSGTIVNVSSGAAGNARDGWSAYCSGKAGLAMLTQCVHVEYGAAGIAVFGLRPGLVDTGMQERIRASGINAISRLDRSALSPPEQPAEAIAWLCTSAANPLRGGELDIREPGFRAQVGLQGNATAAPPTSR